jgi:hypothetical protein
MRGTDEIDLIAFGFITVIAFRGGFRLVPLVPRNYSNFSKIKKRID